MVQVKISEQLKSKLDEHARHYRMSLSKIIRAAIWMSDDIDLRLIDQREFCSKIRSKKNVNVVAYFKKDEYERWLALLRPGISANDVMTCLLKQFLAKIKGFTHDRTRSLNTLIKHGQDG